MSPKENLKIGGEGRGGWVANCTSFQGSNCGMCDHCCRFLALGKQFCTLEATMIDLYEHLKLPAF